MPRLFIGLELPAEVREELAALCESAGSIPTARWIPERNLHLTLKFLGHVEDELVEAICESVKEAVRDYGTFDMELGRAGAFPSQKRARIVWYGLDEGADRVAELASIIEKVVAPYGYPPEARAYHAHITLARVENPGDARAAIVPVAEALRGTRIDVGSVALFESILKRSGAEYSVVRRFPII